MRMHDGSPAEYPDPPTRLERRALRAGGGLLAVGALVFMASIVVEWSLGWPPAGGLQARLNTIRNEWDHLRWTWIAQMLSGLSFSMSALILLAGGAVESRRPHANLLLAGVALGSLLFVAAFGLTLGAYPPALEAYDQHPEVFTVIAGGIRSLYDLGMQLTWICLLVLAVREWVARDGVIPRGSIGILVVAVAVGMALAVTDSATPRTASGVAFVIPLMLGVGLWRAGGRPADQ